uniref:Uncharacterized protein n=1 Tax=Panagrolaimus davidi TaxID=227884 RepID=A0A914PHI2_9BILA
MDSFIQSSNDLNSTQQAIAYTLQQYYDNRKSLTSTFVLYNDEPSEDAPVYFRHLFDQIKLSTRIEKGHTKGIVYFEKTGGFWLIFSMPKFPSVEEYEYPSNAEKFGQSILCMTFNYDELTKIGTQLYYNHPLIYASNLATSMASENPDLTKVIGGQYKKGSPFSSTLTLRTRGGQDFTSFAKSAEFGHDLYDTLVAPTLQTSLYVESWIYGHRIPCNGTLKYTVFDAVTMKVQTTTKFNSTHDHSKLAISTDSSMPFICIGDVNRMSSLYIRGGGTVCIKSKKLWDAYSPMFIVVNRC